jgi:hypothetical protein
MTSGEGEATDGTTADAGPPALQDGEVISPVPQVIRHAGGGVPLTMQWEVKVATGQEGKLLAREQAAAIREILAWMARKRYQDDEPGETSDKSELRLSSADLETALDDQPTRAKSQVTTGWFAWSPAGGAMCWGRYTDHHHYGSMMWLASRVPAARLP